MFTEGLKGIGSSLPLGGGGGGGMGGPPGGFMGMGGGGMGSGGMGSKYTDIIISVFEFYLDYRCTNLNNHIVFVIVSFI